MSDNDLQIVLPESDEVLTCPRCKTANPLESNFCLNCGTRLLIPSSSSFKWSWLLFLIVCMAGVMVYFRFQTTEPKPQRETPVIISTTEKSVARPAEPKTQPKEAVPPKKDEAIALNNLSKTGIPVGVVLIKDINGKIIDEIPAPVVGGGWVALPTRACLGGG